MYKRRLIVSSIHITYNSVYTVICYMCMFLKNVLNVAKSWPMQ